MFLVCKIMFITQLNKWPHIKNRCVQIIDFLFEFRKMFIGSLIRFPYYFRNLFYSKVICGPKKHSYGAISNPGALLLNNHILLLARAQWIPWYRAKGKNNKYYLTGKSLQFLLDKKNNTILKSGSINNLDNFPTNKHFVIEDTRMFFFGKKIMINHSLINVGRINGVLSQVSVISALSELDLGGDKIVFRAIPNLDFPIQNMEKNWVYKEFEEKLLLFYSVNPYRVLALEDKKFFVFKTIINERLSSKLTDPGGFGTRVSWSTNPIEFDENHCLIIIHQIDFKLSGRCYYHWAVLIENVGFMPVKITRRPIFSGMGARGKSPGIRYITSILKIENDICFFAGEGDLYVTSAKMKISELCSLFVGV